LKIIESFEAVCLEAAETALLVSADGSAIDAVNALASLLPRLTDAVIVEQGRELSAITATNNPAVQLLILTITRHAGLDGRNYEEVRRSATKHCLDLSKRKGTQ